MELNLKSLELIYRNAETQEELDIALAHHGVTQEKLFELAVTNGWKPNPIAISNISSQIDSVLTPANDEHIENSNKASVRRLHSLLEYAITRFQYEMHGMSVIGAIESLDVLVKVREKLTKLEMPLYGLSTADPVIPSNPINIFLDTAE